MTKKDYIKLAAILREEREFTLTRTNANLYRDGRLDALSEMQERLVYMLAQDNPRFNAARFNAACTPEVPK